jgi:hypothetical protein
LSGLQHVTWRRLTIAGVLAAPSAAEAWAIKRATFRALSGVHLVSEWFKTSPELALAEIKVTAAACGVAIKPFDPAKHLTRSRCRG